jgi:hypothetical protein
MAYPVLRIGDGPLTNRTSRAKDGALLLFLPAAEIMEKSGGFEHLIKAEDLRRSRTNGQLRKVILKFLVARNDPDFRSSALATLRAINLTREVGDFIAGWIDREYDLVDYSEMEAHVRRSISAIRIFGSSLRTDE